MDLKHLSDEQLLSNTETLVFKEREVLAHILHHFREIERRRLFCGHSSLHDYAIKHLRYSESQANRRIQAMRLLNTLPEIEDKIVSGDLNLTHLNMVASLDASNEEKRNTLEQIAGTVTRQAAKIIYSVHPEAAPESKERVRVVGADKLEFTILGTSQLQEKLEKLKGLLAHSHPNISMGELVEKLCDVGIRQWDPGQQTVRPRKTAPSAPDKRRIRNSNGISKVTVRQIWKNAESKCQKCGSTYALEIDHIKPRAHDGNSQPENLRLLCRKCNQRAAIEQLGLKKMRPYLSR